MCIPMQMATKSCTDGSTGSLGLVQVGHTRRRQEQDGRAEYDGEVDEEEQMSSGNTSTIGRTKGPEVLGLVAGACRFAARRWPLVLAAGRCQYWAAGSCFHSLFSIQVQEPPGCQGRQRCIRPGMAGQWGTSD